MWQLIRRDFIQQQPLFVFALIFPFILYATRLPTPSVYTFSFLFVLLIASTFHLEKSNQSNRTFVSLPIKRNHFVLARYVFIFFSCTVYVVYLWLLNFSLSKNPVSASLILLAFIVIVMAIGMSLPIYYAFQSVWKSMIVHYVLLMIGSLAFVFIMADPFDQFEPFILFVLNVIDFQPFLIVSVCLLGLTIVSYLVSCHFFRTKDIH